MVILKYFFTGLFYFIFWTFMLLIVPFLSVAIFGSWVSSYILTKLERLKDKYV
jgi:hypothetical protein